MRLNHERFREILRDQIQLLVADEERAVGALPKLIGSNPEQIGATLQAVRHLVSAEGSLPPERKRRLARVEELFEAGQAKAI